MLLRTIFTIFEVVFVLPRFLMLFACLPGLPAWPFCLAFLPGLSTNVKLILFFAFVFVAGRHMFFASLCAKLRKTYHGRLGGEKS